MSNKAIIFGIKGYKLSIQEKKLFRKYKPWGIILFSRNIKNISQLKKLIIEIKKTLSVKSYPILIDQEGGKVSRLNKIIDLSIFSQTYFGNLFTKNKKMFYSQYNVYIDKVSEIFNEVGININTVPVLDVKRVTNSNFIGSRSYSKNANNVLKIGNICVNLFKKNKIATVSKHIPGHGFTSVDSHYKRPIINASENELKKKDFKTFKKCRSLFAMTAHAIYPAFDKTYTATQSKIIIKKIIRGHINFKGILISDDISMKSLNYGLKKNAILALNAGCNLILHCNGKINEMRNLVKVVPNIDKFTKKKTSDFYDFLR